MIDLLLEQASACTYIVWPFRWRKGLWESAKSNSSHDRKWCMALYAHCTANDWKQTACNVFLSVLILQMSDWIYFARVLSKNHKSEDTQRIVLSLGSRGKELLHFEMVKTASGCNTMPWIGNFSEGPRQMTRTEIKAGWHMPYGLSASGFRQNWTSNRLTLTGMTSYYYRELHVHIIWFYHSLFVKSNVTLCKSRIQWTIIKLTVW